MSTVWVLTQTETTDDYRMAIVGVFESAGRAMDYIAIQEKPERYPIQDWRRANNGNFFARWNGYRYDALRYEVQ